MASETAARSRYSIQTRQHYRDERTGTEYAARLRGSWPDRLLTALERRAVRLALSQLPGRPWRAIIDIPAGTGKLARVLGCEAPSYVALDISPVMLGLFDDAMPRAVADAEHVPIPAQRADVLVCLRLLHRVPDDVFDGVIAEAMRVARYGCVVSYAGTARSDRLHRALRRVLRRPTFPRHSRSTADLDRVMAAHGGRVVWDRSVSFGATAERVAAIVSTGTVAGAPR